MWRWIACALSGTALAAGAALLGGLEFVAQTPWPGPLGPLKVHGDWMSGAFLVLVGLLGTAASWTALRHEQPTRVLLLLPPFLLGLAFVPIAADPFTLVTAWELMSLSPGLMILLDAKPATRRAALVYLAYSQVSAVALLASLLVAGQAGDPWAGEALPGGFGLASLLALAACLIKAGVMPFHAWLPEAHPVAPGHVSALMSGAMVAMPAYLAARLLLPNGLAAPVAVAVMLLGGLSAALGSLHALHTRDLKRVLAMTTVSHMGTLFGLVGTGLLLAGRGDLALGAAVAASVAAYALVHGLAKGALFLIAGEVHHATGETDLEKLGGLWRASLPLATVAGLAGLALGALPPFGGFPAELALLATLLAALPRLDAMGGAGLLGVLFLLAIGAGAGLAVIGKVVLGTFHGPQRVPPMHPVASRAWMPAGLLLGVSLGVGLLPGVLWGFLPGGPGRPLALTTPLGDAGFLGVLSAGIAAALLVAVATVAGRRPDEPDRVDPWNCGAPPPTPRQTYTAQGLGMPYRILFAELLRPSSDLSIQDAAVAPLAPRKGRYVDPAPNYIEPWLHRPLLRLLGTNIDGLRRLHRGPVQAYLLVALLVLVTVLLALPVFH